MSAVVTALSIREVIEDRLVRAVFQPIVDLDTGEVLALEALARGPAGTPWESPGALFAGAREAGLVTDLDWACRAAAADAALSWGLPRRIRLFVNAEPASLMAPCPRRYAEVIGTAIDQLSVVVEVTERDLAARPAELMAALARIRKLGMGVAIDDVGADPTSLAFLPFVAPDVIKLDMTLLHEAMTPTIAAQIAAVSADAERRGATVLAEGIETDEHRRRAIVLGASLAQGFLLGRPEPIEQHAAAIASTGRGVVPRLSLVPITSDPVPVTPWELVHDSPRKRRTAKSLLMPISHHIEQSAFASDDPVVLGAFQHRRHFTTATVRRYDDLATHCRFVAAIAADLSPDVREGAVRRADLPSDHPLCGEWSVVVIGPHYAAALLAKEVTGVAGPDADREFDYVVTHDRELVIRAAASLLQHVIPD